MYEWLNDIKGLPTLGKAWVASCKRPGNPMLLMDTRGTRLRAKQALTGSIILARHMQRLTPDSSNIGILLPSSPVGMLLNMACMMLGRTAVNLNFTTNLDTLLSSIEQVQLKNLYTSRLFLEKLQERGLDVERLQQHIELIILEDLAGQTSRWSKLRTLLGCFLQSTARLQKIHCHSVNGEDTAVILFSSGSEGSPKGVVLSHHNIMANVNQFAPLLKVQPNDLILANLPLFHAFGLTASLFMPLLKRIPVLCFPDPTDVVNTAKAIDKFRVTVMFGTSTFYRLYLRNPKVQPAQLQGLRLVVAGAEKLQEEVRLAFQEKFGHIIYEGYGATETSPVANVNLPDELALNIGRPLPGCKHGSVGQPIPGTRIMIVDPDSFAPLPVNIPGLVLINGPQVMQGYLGQAGLSRQALPRIEGERWYATGDKGYLDEDGFLFIQDRYSRFAKISGEMIGLGTVEAALRGVVAEAMDDNEVDLLAVTLPDERKGEKIVILTTIALDAEHARQRLIDNGLNALALPSAYLQVDEIPALGSGKRDFGSAKKLAQQLLEARS